MSASSQPSLRSLARGLGCTHKAVQKAFESGRLDGAVGKVEGRLVVLDAELAVRLWASNRVQVSQSKGSPVEVAAPPSQETVSDAPESDTEPMTLVESQIRNNLASARTKELALEVRRGELIERREAERQTFAAARVLRDGLLNIPDRVSAQLAGETDATEVHAILDAAIREALMLVTDEVSDAA